MIYGQPLAFKCLAGLPRFGSHPSTHSAVPWTTCRDREFHSHSRCCDVLASDMHAHSGVITSRVPMAGMPQPARSCIARRCPILQTLTHRTQRVQSRQLLHTTVRAAVTDSGTVKMVVQGRQIELTPSIKSYAQEKVGKAVSHFEGAVKQVDVKLSVSGGDAGHGKRRQRTEVTLYTLRNGIVRAEDVEEDMYASIDLVCDRLTRKLRKVKEKAIARGKWQGRGGPHGESTASAVAPSDEVSDIESDVDDEVLQQIDSAAAASDGQVDQLEDATTTHRPSGTAEIMRTKNFFLKPMTVEAAAEQCDQLGHAFYVFRDTDSDQVQVVYKRRDVGYGVIVPIDDEN